MGAEGEIVEEEGRDAAVGREEGSQKRGEGKGE